MFYPFKKRSRIFFVSLFCALSLVLILGAQGALACGKKGCSKDCKHKASEHGSAVHMKASSEGQTEGQESDTPQVLTLGALSTAEQYTCAMHPEVRADKTSKCPECGMKLMKGDFYEVYTCAKKECPHISAKAGKCCDKPLQKTLMSKEEYYDLAQLQDEYFCPMHSQVVSDKAGKCPKCGMKLEMRTVQKPQEESTQRASYICSMHSEVVSDQAGKCPKCGMVLEKRTVQKESPEMMSYVCPMHPDEVSEKPGKCSQCGMKLKKEISSK